MNWFVLIRGRLSWASFALAVQLAGGVFLLHPAWASTPGSPFLGLDEAAELAISQQPQLLAQQAAVAALNESVPAAGQLPDPKLRLGVVSLPVDTFDFTQEPMDHFYGTDMGIRDPFGNAIRILQPAKAPQEATA